MTTTKMHVPYSYLVEQFRPDQLNGSLATDILADIERELSRGHFTLGSQVQEFEEAWAEAVGTRYAVGVANGTDAIKLLLRAMGVGPGWTVVTAPNTFLATVGAIIEVGATPFFGDIGDDYLMHFIVRPSPKTFWIPVWWGGQTSDDFAGGPNVIADAAQAIGAKPTGLPSAYSLHPLKNVNVWGDGGMVATDDQGLADEVKLLRNHGLEGRDVWRKPGVNSRLDTIQAIVGLHVLKDLNDITMVRRLNAGTYDDMLTDVEQVRIPPRDPARPSVYHLYQIEVADRDGLLAHLNANGVEARIHYPTPLHLQPALAYLGYKPGDFPRAEAFADNHITLPIHQYLSLEQLEYVVAQTRVFYNGRG